MKYYTRIRDAVREFEFERKGPELLAHVDDRTYRVDLSMVGDGTAFSLLVNGRSHDLIVDQHDGHSLVQVGGEVIKVLVEDERERTANAVAGARAGGVRTVNASMPGVVVELMVEVGDVVEDGQTVLILEAMKMQNPILAEGGGKVVEVYVGQGEALGAGAPLFKLDSD